MPKTIPYGDIIAAATETAERLVASIPGLSIQVTADGGKRASVTLLRHRSYRISLPTMAPTEQLTKAEADNILGFLVHELIHIKRTQMDLMAQARNMGGMELKAILNAIEDVQMEREEIASGEIGNARELLETVAESVFRKCYSETGNPWPREPFGGVVNGIAAVGRLKAGMNIPAAERMAQTWQDEPVRAAALQVAFDGLPSVTSTQQALALAVRVMAAMNAAQQQQQQQQQL